MNTRKAIFSIFIIIIILLSGTASAFFSKYESKNYSGNPLSKTAKWTVMYYICGGSSYHCYVSPFLENLSKAGSSQNFNLVVLVDNKESGDSKLYYIDKSGEKIELNDIYGWPDEIDMNNLNTFEKYCTEMMLDYPANHYAFITCASGGTGWQQYCLPDSQSKNYAITTPAFANSLKNIVERVNHKIDVLFVSCAGNAIEFAYEIAPYVDYIVGTQDCFSNESVIPRFFEAVWDLRNNSNMSPEEFSKRAPLRCNPEPFYYYESYKGELPFICKILNKLPFEGLHTLLHYPSSSVVNLNKMDELANKIRELVINLISNLNDKDFKENVRKARIETQEYGKCFPKIPILWKFYENYGFKILAYDCVIDFYNFIEILRYYIDNEQIKNQCNSILEYFDEVIPEIKKISYDNSNGLNIYFPKKIWMYNKYLLCGKIPSPYGDLKFSKDTKWDDFLIKFLLV